MRSQSSVSSLASYEIQISDIFLSWTYVFDKLKTNPFAFEENLDIFHPRISSLWDNYAASVRRFNGVHEYLGVLKNMSFGSKLKIGFSIITQLRQSWADEI
jgi:hypothetical protein